MKSVLITGCSDGGIGSALALTFATRGLLVFASARSLSKMSELANLPNVHLLELDIVKPADIASAVSAVKKETGGTLDYLVNNAAQARYMPMLDETVEQAKELFELNVWSQLRMVQAFAPLLIEAKGCAVYISSVSGYVTQMPWMGTYAMTKRSTEIMFDALRLELEPFGVTTISVVTGPVKSRVNTHQELWKLPENSRYADVEQIITKRSEGEDGSPRQDTMKYAEGVVDKILKGNPKFWAGANIGIIKWMATWLPRSVLDWALKQNSGVDVMLKNKK
ncbi:hypothetical protein HBI56_154650 [Parastagonospora nodorum]|uniref:NAD(P)-binding protein n=1 Tax=Phaeosphaeria nodorum (strain SN15 / ATCC MYA-4574 / FGSC 10173) TaxID=321614 RepID=A0A7U2FH39_PHANO|nr:hypothetical protein HBH56_117320 [Parastagonospora nodorum]QRD05189.1 hypothetical protein JI435_111020 [Parastagonospora nodorum SN15]KAH3928915.1 hypothetical protein HBH54_131880 [Parastagonospora nodorum]KAH3959774.1 hypothetical protein HBH51_195760 [Parastagonospora nodorum]KAH3973750.1 hypothetical protein HBH52_139640 [Parastagonospora nodorum]